MKKIGLIALLAIIALAFVVYTNGNAQDSQAEFSVINTATGKVETAVAVNDRIPAELFHLRARDMQIGDTFYVWPGWISANRARKACINPAATIDNEPLTSDYAKVTMTKKGAIIDTSKVENYIWYPDLMEHDDWIPVIAVIHNPE